MTRPIYLQTNPKPYYKRNYNEKLTFDLLHLTKNRANIKATQLTLKQFASLRLSIQSL